MNLTHAENTDNTADAGAPEGKVGRVGAAGPTAGDLLRHVRELELIAERNVSTRLSGNYLTTYRGTGLDFHEARKYIPGESVRRIDWRMTARMREAYVQVHHEERQREIFLAIDISSSMLCGWQERTKLETAIEAAATLAVAAVRSGDRLGFLTYSDRVHSHRRPRAGRLSLFELLRELCKLLEVPPQRSEGTDARAAIHHIQRLRSRHMVVFFLSDFLEADLGDDLRFLGAHHDTTLVRISEPLEGMRPPPALRRWVKAPEGQPSRQVWGSAAHQGPFAEPGATGQPVAQPFADAVRHKRLHHLTLDTGEAVGEALQRAFHRRQLRGGAVRRFPDESAGTP